jgi:hypothetical protein
MAAPKGHPRYGGREKGKPNRSTLELQEIARKHECDPFEILILFAKGDYKALGYEKERVVSVNFETGEEVKVLTITPELRQKSAKDACEYLHAKRKAIELKPDGDTEKKIESIEDFLRKLPA